jgi:hypothetical protein
VIKTGWQKSVGRKLEVGEWKGGEPRRRGGEEGRGGEGREGKGREEKDGEGREGKRRPGGGPGNSFVARNSLR